MGKALMKTNPSCMGTGMKQLGGALLLLASVCSAQGSAAFQPATTNVWGAEYPRVDGAGRVEVRIKASEATKVRLNFWSGPKVDMAKQADGFWTSTTEPLASGLHCYSLVIDGVEVITTSRRRAAMGTQEPERMREGIRQLHAALSEAGIQHVHVESPGTDHEWQTWRRSLRDFAPRLFR
jgi:hypothetical protein